MPQFTKAAIVSAFMRLLEEKPLDKITVTDVVTSCGVNRNTFYYYYQDIYALVEEIFETETEKIVGDDTNYESWQEGFLKATEFALKEKKAIYHLYNSVNRAQLENYLFRVTQSAMTAFVKNQAEGLIVSDEYISLMSGFYTAALVGIVMKWLENGMKNDPEEYIHKIGRLLDGDIREAFLRLPENEQDKKQTNQ